MASDLRGMLEEDEGRVAHAYRDSLGYWTIGCGRLIDERKGGGLSPEEIDFLLDNDIKAKREGVLAALPWAGALDETRLAVLIGMAFQMGIQGLLGFVNTLALIRYGKYQAAAQGMLESTWSHQTPARAARMAKQMETGVWQ